jgi:anti-sigma factor RsiW
MSLQNGRTDSIKRYLLGELSQHEQEEVEQLLMSDDELYQELLFAEDELIDDYIFDKLPEEDRSKFKQRFLRVPELRQSVGFTAALRKHAQQTAPRIIAEKPAPQTPSLFDRLKKFFMQPAVAVAFAAVLLSVIGINVWLLKQNSDLKKKVAQLEAGQSVPQTTYLQEQLASAQSRNEQLSADLLRNKELLAEASRKLELAQQQQSTPTPRSGAGVLAIALTPGVVRDSSGQWTKFSLTADKKTVSFRLDLAANDYANYEAALQTLEGQQKLTKKGLKASKANLVLFDVPASMLPAGDYRIVLSGANSTGPANEISSYYFRVLK